MKQRRVVCAAIRKDDVIICGARHFDMTMHAAIDNTVWTHSYFKDAMQGFIDQWGKFMTREEAFEVATAANQIIKKSGNPDSKQLFSEDLY